MEKKDYKKVHKKENKKNYVLMKISSISLIVSMIFSVVLILLGIFSTIKLPVFIALIIIDLLILVVGVATEFISEKNFDKDYKNYKVEKTVVARKIEVAPRKTKVKKEVEEKTTPKKTTTTKKSTKSVPKTTSKSATKKSTKSAPKTPSKKSTTKKTTKKA